MTTEEHYYCDYCGSDIGHKESYSVEKDRNGKHWCGECSMPSYAVYDVEENGVGQYGVGLKKPPGYWSQDEYERKVEYWRQKDYWEGDASE